MKIYTGTALTPNDIDAIVNDNNIEDNSQLLIQIFAGKADFELIKSFQKYFQDNFPQATLIGSTSDGVIENGNVFVDKDSLLSFTLFEKTTLKSLIMDHEDSYHDYFKSGYMLASHLVSDDTKAFITFADGTHTNGEEYVNGISSFDKNIVVSGGLAGDNGSVSKTYVFDKEYISSNGAIAVALDSKVLQVRTNYSFDWMPIGKQLSVTKSIDNRIYEIDGMTAVELYSKYMGKELADLLPQVGIEFPLIVNRNGIDTARAVLHKHDDGSLTFAGNILEGEFVRFGMGNVETILRGGEQNLRSILEKSENKAEVFFIYSCMARRRFMGQHIEKELEIFSKLAPTTGFFTYGEFFHINGTNQLLNETMTVLALSESDEKVDKSMENPMLPEKHYGANPVHVASHLINVISKELDELNQDLETRILRATDLIYKQAYYDKLTKLPNRLKLINKLPESIDKTLLLLNIDDFTLINDFYGHDTGDSVLRELASLLKLFCLDENAELFKLPSDEFAVILHTKYIKKDLQALIRKILDIVKNTYIDHDYYQIKVDVTVSASSINSDGLGLINANMALKLAKNKSLDFLIFDDSLMISKNYETNLNIATQIREAIDSDNIIPYFQPILCAKTGKVQKYESLVRLRQSDGKILSPYTFLEIAQKIKLYPQITMIMIEKTFVFFKENGVDFTINLSIEDIVNPETRVFIFEKIEEFGIAQQLTIEIVETQEIKNQVAVESFIEYIYRYGAKIAIDDFGSGFANFHHMTKIKANYLKIDGSLIKNIDKDENARLVVETIVVFAQKLKMKTVAEFVHSKEVYDIVCELNIDLVQGYYFSEPLKNI